MDGNCLLKPDVHRGQISSVLAVASFSSGHSIHLRKNLNFFFLASGPPLLVFFFFFLMRLFNKIGCLCSFPQHVSMTAAFHVATGWES